jgi:endogenous inhibitor of DNA gyrase (YacG/DUF329 family)
MITLTDVLRQYGPAYLQEYGRAMPATHRQAIEVLSRCRSGELGYALYRCTACQTWQAVPRSCGNRHCPTCQGHKTRQWLEKQMQRRLPCPYFLLTFTVPEELRRLIRSNQRVGYEAMFQSSVAALRKLAADERYLGATDLGLLAVLHTWGRTLEYHPHIHVLVPAGGLSRDADQWRAAPCHFLVPVWTLSVIYRAKMRDALKAAGLEEQVDPAVWRSDWVVHCEAVGDGQNCLGYLARYVFRVAISNQRLVSCDDGRVVFRYKKVGSNRWRQMTLDATEFLRRFLQHVLPSGFLRVRHYGFLHASNKRSPAEIGHLIEQYYSGLVERLPEQPTTTAAPMVPCPECGEPMELVKLSFAPPVALCDSG